ncbi:hypothetical protein HMPREF1870_01268 [Bacteroidales bacterium KA00344]|nr:hypothetical protein HMPREF1870_01268 [Bacteroidales bacterium KA00344]
MGLFVYMNFICMPIMCNWLFVNFLSWLERGLFQRIVEVAFLV